MQSHMTWTTVLVDIGKNGEEQIIADKTLQSEADFNAFCNKYGYKLVSFLPSQSERKAGTSC